MSREIKFRVWSNLYKKFISDNIVIRLNGRIDEISYGEIMGEEPECILQQFTGLKDNNNKELYEGDICLVDFLKAGKQICELKWYFKGFDYFLTTNPDEISFPMCIKDAIIEVKLLGNIFENPELCK